MTNDAAVELAREVAVAHGAASLTAADHLTVSFSSGGLAFAAKGQPDALTDVEAHLSPVRQQATLSGAAAWLAPSPPDPRVDRDPPRTARPTLSSRTGRRRRVRHVTTDAPGRLVDEVHEDPPEIRVLAPPTRCIQRQRADDRVEASSSGRRSRPRRAGPLGCSGRPRDEVAQFAVVSTRENRGKAIARGLLVGTTNMLGLTVDAASVLDEMPDAVIVIDPRGNVVWANRAAEDQMGWRLTDVRGQSASALVHPDDLPTALAALSSVQDKAIGSAVELRVRVAAGGYRTVEIRGRSATEVPGVDGIVLVLRDVTDRRRWEVAAGNSALLQAIVDNAPAITMLLSREGIIRGSSRALTRLLGRDLEFTLGRSFADLAIDADRHLVASEIALAASRGGRRAFEAMFSSVSGRAPVPMSISVVNLLDDLSVGGLVITATDITPLAEARAELQHLATHDVLTGLPNRGLLRDRLAHALAGAKRRSSPLSVLYIDVDDFKTINDGLGHTVGDGVLVEIARRMTAIVRSSDTVARVGGDEFVVVAEDGDCTAVEALVKRLHDVMSHPVAVDRHELRVRLSIGSASLGAVDAGIDELLARADAAMYRVKASRKQP